MSETISETSQAFLAAQHQAEAILQDPSNEPLTRIQAVMQMGCWPESVYHMWACDCAERALQHEVNRGASPHPVFWQVLINKRQWLEGTCSEQELQDTLQQAQAVAHQTALHPSCYEASMAVVDAGRDVAYALRAAAWALAAVAYHAPAEQAEALRHGEALWQLEHFSKRWLESLAKSLI